MKKVTAIHRAAPAILKAKPKENEVIKMTKKSANIAKGVGIAMALGGATALISGSMANSTQRKMKKTVDKAAKSVENFVSGINSVMK